MKRSVNQGGADAAKWTRRVTPLHARKDAAKRGAQFFCTSLRFQEAFPGAVIARVWAGATVIKQEAVPALWPRRGGRRI